MDEESSHASNAEVDLNKLFRDLTFASGEELALSAGQPLSKVHPHLKALKAESDSADRKPILLHTD